MKTFVINLVSRPDRLEELMHANIPFNWERFEASTMDKFKDIENRRLRAHAACQDSHMRLLSKIYEDYTDHDYFLILEDDVVFKELEEGLPEFPKDADLVYLGGDPKSIEEFEEYESPYTRVYSVLQTHAYIVKRSFIPTIMDEFNQGYYKADVVLSRALPKGNCYILKEPIAIQSDSVSDIDK